MLEFIISQAQIAHWIIFILLCLAGFNIPISEDITIISAGILTATLVPENLLLLAIASYSGAIVGDATNYWLARKLGPAILKYKFVAQMVSPEKIQRVENYFQKYGIFTILIGRFIPFGVRNGLFMSAGFAKMNFGKFISTDAFTALGTTMLLFSLGYAFGNNYQTLLSMVNQGKIYILLVFFAALGFFFFYRWLKIKKAHKIISNKKQV